MYHSPPEAWAEHRQSVEQCDNETQRVERPGRADGWSLVCQIDIACECAW